MLTTASPRLSHSWMLSPLKRGAVAMRKDANAPACGASDVPDIPVGGKTPLSAGLTLAFKVIEQEKRTHPDVMPMMILLTDGAGNVSITDLAPQEEAHRAADQFREAKIRGVVINMELTVAPGVVVPGVAPGVAPAAGEKK